jgi:hypothetical protein
MSTDISPIALELLYSPGFFLVQEAKLQPHANASEVQKIESVNQELLPPEPSTAVVEDVPVNLIFILSAPESLQTTEQQMLERMAGFIRNELGLGKEWLQGGSELWHQTPGKHHWVFFGNQLIPDEPDLFAFLNHQRGPLLRLPSEKELAPDAALKKRALEALKFWAKGA